MIQKVIMRHKPLNNQKKLFREKEEEGKAKQKNTRIEFIVFPLKRHAAQVGSLNNKDKEGNMLSLNICIMF